MFFLPVIPVNPLEIKDCYLKLCVSVFRVPCDRRTETVTSVRVPSVFFTQCFLFPLCPTDPLVRPEFLLLLLLEQWDRSLEDNKRLFLLLAKATSYPDVTFCASGTAGKGGDPRSSSARSSKVPSSARSLKMPTLPPAPVSSTAVSPLSVQCEPRGSAILQCCRGLSIPYLRL